MNGMEKVHPVVQIILHAGFERKNGPYTDWFCMPSIDDLFRIYRRRREYNLC
jgi:hypothetical protein